MSHYFDNEAELGSEEDDGDFQEGDEDREEPRRSNGANLDDSSEEEEDDEAVLAEEGAGFIADEEEEEDEDARRRRRAERKKRKREERQDEEEILEEEDLDLIAEANPQLAAARRAEKPTGSKFKRLKRRRDDRTVPADPEDDFWGDQDDVAQAAGRGDDDMGDFIEEDWPDEAGEGELALEDAEVARTVSRGYQAIKETAGLDEDALEDFRAAFGDGHDYDFALEQEQEDDRRVEGEDGESAFKPIELKDVFEPSELQSKFLTDEDNVIRMTDEPERFQVARKPYRHLTLTEDQSREEALWISKLMFPKARLEKSLQEPFQAAVAKILEFFNTDELEVPFIFRHRKDHLIHERQMPVQDPQPGGPTMEKDVVKLLQEGDLWEILDLDLKFRALIERRNALQKTYDELRQQAEFQDEVFEEMLPRAETVEELQDVQEYLYFEHSSRVADMNLVNTNGAGTQRKRPGANKLIYDKVRNSRVYSLVRAFGITADAFARNAARAFGGDTIAAKQYTEDPGELPEVMAQSEDILDPPEFSSGHQCMRAARQMFAEELATSPRLRRVLRQQWYSSVVFDSARTEKGLRKIDEQHPYYEFKYLRNQRLQDIAETPGLFLRMLKAEEEGLAEVRCRMPNFESFKKALFKELESDNLSDIADAWNKERREALSMALDRLNRIMARGIKENMRSECENQVAQRCRNSYYDKLDQAPFKPKGEKAGTIPRVLAMSNGNGTFGRDPVTYVLVEDDSKLLESSRFTDLNLAVPEKGVPDGKDIEAFTQLVYKSECDVIAVSGYSTESLKLYRQIQKVVQERNVLGREYPEQEDDEDGPTRRDLIDVVIVNDEVARLYKDSERAAAEYPALTSLGRYCVALARYMQNPLSEYASLGRDIISISFDPDQRYLGEERLTAALTTAIVDVVNLVGVDINEAMHSMHAASLLPYVSGLGHRKANWLLKAINLHDGEVINRDQLLGDPDRDLVQAVGPRVFVNCASFLKILWDPDNEDPNADFLDGTRIHPEDYDIARKMAADALELDEEDIEQEVNDHGPGAVVRKLDKDGEAHRVEDLILEEYAEQLWAKFRSRKRATLETIRSELQGPYEELRNPFEDNLRTEEIFTMFTGETKETLDEGMIVPIQVKKVGDDFIEGKLDCGIDVTIEATDISEDGRPARTLFAPMSTIRGKITRIDKRSMAARLTLLESELRRPYKKDLGRDRDEWDEEQEEKDKEAMKVKNDVTGRTQRVIKHPLFRPFNSAQAEEYLGSQSVGDVVIRPSSKGLDHLVITWKVAEGVYKHIDVLELDKENEFSVGKQLKIEGRYTYSDLDELIVNHVQSMSKKVNEMMGHEKFQRGTRNECERWLTTYLEANPKNSMYVFCTDTKYPGYFHLCFKASQNSPLHDWPVKVVPGAFELQKNPYTDMRALTNGFKLLYANLQKSRMGRR